MYVHILHGTYIHTYIYTHHTHMNFTWYIHVLTYIHTYIMSRALETNIVLVVHTCTVVAI